MKKLVKELWYKANNKLWYSVIKRSSDVFTEEVKWKKVKLKIIWELRQKGKIYEWMGV